MDTTARECLHCDDLNYGFFCILFYEPFVMSVIICLHCVDFSYSFFVYFLQFFCIF